MCRFFTRLRLALLFATFLSVIANGAQAHLSVGNTQQLSVPICGMGQNQVTVISIGDPVPANGEGQSCCGDCISFAATVPMAVSLQTRYAPQTIETPREPVIAYRPGAPVWPGAPPHGPPALSLV